MWLFARSGTPYPPEAGPKSGSLSDKFSSLKVPKVRADRAILRTSTPWCSFKKTGPFPNNQLWLVSYTSMVTPSSVLMRGKNTFVSYSLDAYWDYVFSPRRARITRWGWNIKEATRKADSNILVLTTTANMQFVSRFPLLLRSMLLGNSLLEYASSFDKKLEPSCQANVPLGIMNLAKTRLRYCSRAPTL
jgi:hypothetical protein